jgi:DNA gyrase/topoisomerase IV subunit A
VTLEAKLTFASMHAQNVRRDSEPRRRHETQAEASRLAGENGRLREKNDDLQEELDEMKAMVEVLRAEVSGRKGLHNDPSRSPIMVGSPRLYQL